MVEDDDDLARITNLQHLAPRRRQEGIVDEDRRVDIDDDEIARRHFLGAACPREDLFNDGHAHAELSCRRRKAT